MTDQTPALSAAERRLAIRRALRSHPSITDEDRRAVPSATMHDLGALCFKYGIDVASVVRAAMMTPNTSSADDADTDADTETKTDTPVDDVDVFARVEAQVPTVVADIMSGLVAGGADGVRAQVRALLTRAETPRVVVKTEVQTVEKVIERRIEVGAVDVSKIAGHVPTVVKTDAAASVLDAKGLPKTLKLDVYDAPDAPGVDPYYAWPSSSVFAALLSQMARGRHVMLWGPAGTGKTSFAEQIAARTRRPFVTILCDRTTDKEPLVGMLTPKGWQDGLLTRAIRRPGTLILIDEPSAARAGALLAFNSVLGPTRDLYIQDTGERVVVAPGVSFILADNTGGLGDASGQYEDTGRLNRSTLDRIGATHEMEYLPPATEAKVLAAKTGAPLALAELAVAYAVVTRESARRGAITHAVGMRRLLAWSELIVDGASPDTAYDLAIHNAAPHDDREALRQLYRTNVDKKRVLAALSGNPMDSAGQTPDADPAAASGPATNLF